MRESLKQLLIAFMIGLILCPPSLVYAAGIQVDGGAPAANQATMDAAPNGVPLINIVAPNGSGMSHNMFTDFNVDAQGVILNNSVSPGISQLGGALAPNTNLGGTAASTILNEVTGTGRTSIGGYTEIFGAQANYILANPNGISINGGGFINTPKATMTTGTPQFSGGAFQGLDVIKGDIVVEGAGINTNNIDAFEIVTRTAQINADIYAKQLNVVTGQNRYNPGSGTATPLTPDGSAIPTISIDSTALGGMYAGRIKLVGTEAGVGVNIQGVVQATEHMEMTADGKIQIKNAASSAQTLALTSTNNAVEISGTVKAVGTATLTGQTVTVAKLDPADSPKVNAGTVVINAGTLDNQALIAGDSSVAVAATNINNTGTIYSGDTAAIRVGNTLLNNRGIILSKNDMTLEGTAAGQKMDVLQNDSGSIESLDGSLIFRARTFNNNNSQFVLTQGATELAYSEGGYWYHGDEGDECYGLFIHYIGSPRIGVGNTAHQLTPAQFAAAGIDASRHVVTRDELLAAIAETDLKLAADPNYLTAAQKTDLAYARSVAVSGRTYIVTGWGSGVVYSATTTQDTASGQGLGSNIAAQGNILIEADDAKNIVSKITTATGDITINANTFENVGKDIYERTAYKWGTGIFQNHNSPSVIPLGGGTEVALKATDHAYGTLDAGNKVIISSGAVANGVTERNGIIVAPDPATQQQKVTDVTSLISVIPVNGLFKINTNPAHNYAIETDPSLTDLDTFFGSAYSLSRMGFNPNDEANKLLGDPFYETQLVRNQILELTGRRFFEDGISTDTEQMVRLMDNAIQARTDLNLSVGIALTQEQIAALGADIVWLERQTVNGQDVLVPVVYLGSNSLNRIAQGGSVIIGKDALIEASGEVFNQGLMVAANDIEINADTIFNRQGTISGQNVGLTATDSVRVMGGFIKGDTVALKAGNDVVIASDTVEFKDTDTTATQIAMAGKVEAANGLSIEAGRDIGILGAEVTAGGDATLKAGGNVAISTVETQTQSATSGSGYNSHSESTTNHGSTVTTGGSLTVEAGKDLAVHGSQIAAGGDVTLKAAENVSITAATDTNNLYAHGAGSKGGFFGGKSSFTREDKAERTIASSITSGGSITAEAGTGGVGDLLLLGSQVKADGDVTLKAEGDIQVTPNQVENFHKFEETSSGFMNTKSMASDESRDIANTRPEIEAGGKVTLDAKENVTLQAARITSGDETEIIAEDGQVAMLVSKDSQYEHKVKSDTGFFSWSSKDEGSVDETVLHTEINAAGGLTFTTAEGIVVEYKETGDLKTDIGQLAQAPGLEWMGEVLARDDVNWQAVQEVHNRWKEENGGVGGPGISLVALAVAVALTWTGVGGTFASWAMGVNTGTGAAVGSAGATAAAGTVGGAASAGVAAGAVGAAAAGTAGLSATELAIHTAIAAGFNSLVTQATMQLIGNKGDVGAAMKALVSIETVRSLTTTMLTAGLTQGVMGAASVGAKPELLSQAKNMEETTRILNGELLRTAIRTGVGAGVNTAVNGGKLDENVIASLKVAAAASIGSQGAGAIGKAFRDDDIDVGVKYIAHAALGGVLGEITSGDAGSGALGAVVGEFTGELLADEIKERIRALEIREEDVDRWVNMGVDLSKLAAGFAAAAAGGDIDVAADAGGNAAENNALCGGVCIAALAAVVWSAYAAQQGEGDFVAGVEKIGAGDDDFNKLVEQGLLAATDKAFKVAPESTTWVIEKLKVLGEGIDAVVTYTDEKTGKIVSRNWNTLSESDRNLISGLTNGVSFVVSAGTSGTLYKIANRGADVVDTVADAAKLIDRVEDVVDTAEDAAKIADQIKDVWAKAPIERGKQIEDYLAATEYKDWFNVGQLNNGKFDLVDFQKGNNLISLKTVDTTGKTWLGRMQEHIVDLGSRGATVEGETANMILDLRVQPGGSKAAQSLIDFGQKRGVTVVVKEF